jgi:hypothetical protein
VHFFYCIACVIVNADVNKLGLEFGMEKKRMDGNYELGNFCE